MNRIQVTVEETVLGDADHAFDIMLRFDQYHEWWPIPVKCTRWKNDVVRSKLLITPFPFVHIGWKISSYIPGREIIIHYYKGMHNGVGVWSFTEVEGGVRIAFEIDIVPKNRLFALAYRLFNVRNTHIRQVQDVIAALVERLPAE